MRSLNTQRTARRVLIHTKLAAVLSVPVVVLVIVAALEAVHNTRVADDVQDQAAEVKAATGPNGLFNALQDERNRAIIDLVGQGELVELPVADNAEAREETDHALAAFQARITAQTTEIQAAYAPAFSALGALDGLRRDVDADDGPFDLGNTEAASTVFWRYTDLVDALLDANSQVTLTIDDPSLRRGADLSYLASRQTDLIARLVVTLLLASVSPGGLDSSDEIVQVGGLYGQAVKGTTTIEGLATGDYADIGATLLAEHRSRGFLDRIVPATIATGQVDVPAMLAAVSVPRDESYYGFRTNVKRIVEQEADDLAAAARRRASVFQALAVIVVVGGVAMTWSVSRSITRPLRLLTRQATEMASRRLPDAVVGVLGTPRGDDVVVPHLEPIEVSSRDEVGDVAAALNKVQDAALELAVEQAVLRRNIADSFVNLGRRNQLLLGRQLDFITELEQTETDADTLTDLFRLDHLATRMRRNAESLLVLAGSEPPRTWAGPVRISETIRAAVGEVEDYQRVDVRTVEPATIPGSAAADLTHLLAELIENALLFSPPDRTVEILGRSNTVGTPADGYALAVIDTGLGMPPDELSRANRRLAGTESFTTAPSKYLGHYVAGHLAARHGIDVILYQSPERGITAVVNLPPALLMTEAEPSPIPMRSWSAGSRGLPTSCDPPSPPLAVALHLAHAEEER
jgi:signal transduction histidine kinase